MAELRRILIIEDYEYICKALVSQIRQDLDVLRRLLDVDELDLEVSPVLSLAQAEKALQIHDADLIILDLDLDDGRSQLETLHEMTEIQVRARSTAVLALYSGTKFHTPDGVDFLRNALNKYTLHGVIPKSTPAKRFHESIARLLAREEWYPAELLRKLAEPSTAKREQPRMGLTPREWDVAQLLAEGLPNRKIAVRLGITEPHTRQVVGDILEKLQLPNRTAAAVAVVKAKAGGAVN